MKVFALTCPQCGGSQDVFDDQRVLECGYCGTLLRAERSASGDLERLLIEAREANAELIAENRRLAITTAIHRLDAAWTAHRPELLVQGKLGLREPSVALGLGAILSGCVGVVTGLILLMTLGSDGVVGIPLIGVGAAAAGFGLWERSAGQRFESVKSRYERRRAELCDQLETAEQALQERPSYEDTKARRKRLDSLAYPAADA